MATSRHAKNGAARGESLGEGNASLGCRHCSPAERAPEGTQYCTDFMNPTGAEMNIFVGNLAEAVTDVELADLFKPFGQVNSVEVMRELFTGKCRGFAFVEMPGKNHSLAAISGLNGKDFHGQPLKVHEARDRPSRGGRRR